MISLLWLLFGIFEVAGAALFFWVATGYGGGVDWPPSAYGLSCLLASILAFGQGRKLKKAR